jgi:hypothetical protein
LREHRDRIHDEREVQQLDDESFAAFREWFMAYENARWDRQLAKDSNDGKLDSLVQEANQGYHARKTKPL